MIDSVGESRDGQGAGDHDEAYTWGYRWSSDDYSPFTTLMFSRLLVLRSKVLEGLAGVGDLAADPYATDLPDLSTSGPSD